MKLSTSTKAGFTLVEIMIVVAIIGLLAAIAIPNFVKARTASQKSACIANLKQIEAAKEQWAMDTRAASTATPAASDLYGTTAYVKNTPVCPSGGTYTIGNLATRPTCNGDTTHVLP